MLKIDNLNVNVDNKNILKNINLQFETGKNYCILGQNGS
jgi:Fe-S cluster assembly ATPase SufC